MLACLVGLAGCGSGGDSGDDGGGNDTGSLADATLDTTTSTTRGAVSGVVRDGAGNALGSVAVTVSPAGGRQEPEGFCALTDDDGTWDVGNLPPGTYTCQYSLAGYGETESEVEVEAGEVTETEDDLPNTGGEFGALVGKVIDATDQPVPGAELELNNVDLRTLSNDDGTFCFSPLAAGLYNLEVRLPSDEDGHYVVTISAGETNEIVCKVVDDGPDGEDDPTSPTGGSAVIHGLVKDPDGNPIAGAKVEADGADNEVATGADGVYHLANLAAGCYVLQAEAEGFVDREIEVTIGAGETIDLNIELAPESGSGGSTGTGKIHGMVTDASTGEPLALAQVEIQGLDIDVFTDETGHYSLENLPAGTFELEFDKPLYEDECRTVTLTDGEIVELDVALPTDDEEPGDDDSDDEGDDDGDDNGDDDGDDNGGDDGNDDGDDNGGDDGNDDGDDNGNDDGDGNA